MTQELDIPAIMEALNGHSIFSPSGSAMWLGCSGSLIPNIMAPDEAGEDAAEGTVGHAVAEEWLLRIKAAREAGEFVDLDDYRPNDLVGEVRTIAERTTSFEIEITHEMLDYLREYVVWCVDLPGTHYIESKVYFSQITPIEGQGGTADHAACEWQKLTISDLKYGRGVPVVAKNNTQGLLYGLGFFYEWDWLYDFQEITIRIAQPRRDKFTTWTVTRQELLDFAEWAKERALAAWQPDAPRTPGKKTCQWCKVQATCPAHLAWALKHNGDAAEDCFEDLDADEITFAADGAIEGVSYTVKDMVLAADSFVSGRADLAPQRDPLALNTEALAKILPYRKLFEKWFAAVEAELLSRAEAGETIPGYKIAEGRAGHRKWADDQFTIKMLLKNGIPLEDILQSKLLSPAAMEEAVRGHGFKKKDAVALINSAVIRPPGRDTLVQVNDDRPALDPPGDAFDDLDAI